MKHMLRDGKIELMRFLASLMIMCDHMGIIGLKELNRPFRGTWIYVEFFLILSGFFTANHFAKPTAHTDIVENSVKYTVNKYSRFIPHTFCAVSIVYIFSNFQLILDKNLNQLLFEFGDMPYEILMLSAANTNGTKLFPLWFLSAIFLMTPFICIICQLSNKYKTIFLSFYPAVFYYLYRAHSIGAHEYPNQLVRVFCGMSLGVLLFHVSRYISSYSLSNIEKLYLTALTVFCYFLLFYMGWNSITPVSAYLTCFVVIVCLTFCNNTYLPLCSNKIFIYLGKLSMPMFIWHRVVADFLSQFFYGTTMGLIISYYVFTIIISALLIKLYSCLNLNRKK